jgi:tRNA (guanine10-N2)-dimethyltransferase
MKYFFVLGNHPALSIAELYGKLSITSGQYLAPDIFVAEIEENIEARNLIKSIGGTIKIGRIIETLSNKSNDIFEASLELFAQVKKTGKFNFGISLYGNAKIDGKRIGLALKQELKNQGVSCRFVVSREKTLSSVVVEQNKLLTSGQELVYIVQGSNIILGVTEAVQLFKELSARDYGRPARDDRSGMLPPKLAQMMINMSEAKKKDMLLDPFCGSGTILTEAMLMGYENIIGSDISSKAIEDTRKNITWILEKTHNKTEPKLQVTDARQLSKFIKKESATAIVTETYLGPQRGEIDFKKVSGELTSLYNQTIKEIFFVLKKGGRAVIALPAFIIASRPKLLSIEIKPLHPVDIIPADIHIQTGKTERGTFLYGRPDQRVWREIIILEK